MAHSVRIRSFSDVRVCFMCAIFKLNDFPFHLSFLAIVAIFKLYVSQRTHSKSNTLIYLLNM